MGTEKQYNWSLKLFSIGLQFWFKVNGVCVLCFRFLRSELLDRSLRVLPLLYGLKVGHMDLWVVHRCDAAQVYSQVVQLKCNVTQLWNKRAECFSFSGILSERQPLYLPFCFHKIQFSLLADTQCLYKSCKCKQCWAFSVFFMQLSAFSAFWELCASQTENRSKQKRGPFYVVWSGHILTFFSSDNEGFYYGLLHSCQSGLGSTSLVSLFYSEQQSLARGR